MSHLADSTRRLVSERAMNRCEYCLIHEQDTILGGAIAHIISLKHGGSIDKYCQNYRPLFVDVRNDKAFRDLHLGILS